jgi:outer membrane protein OmpA-like peptidoglycan-associated protein
MNGLAKLLLPFAAAMVLSGCAGMELEKAQSLMPEGSAFNMNLYKGYVDLAASEYAEADYADSDVFAERAIGAGSGQTVAPEQIYRRALPEDKVAELTGARQRLTSALDAGAAERKPAEAAHAQVMFDCWMQEQEENFQPEDIARCRGALMAALEVLEVRAVAKAEPAPPLIPGPYVVFFDFDKAELTDQAKVVLANVARDAEASKIARIFTSGHTDRAGANAYNDSLAKMRVDAVAKYLIASGIDKGKILTADYGEEQPKVATPDGQVEAKNRRVEINFGR